MNDRDSYVPGPAGGARVDRNGELWTLVLVRVLRHPPDRVWQALTDPVHLREWAPFDANGSLDSPGATVRLTTAGTQSPQVSETTISRARAPEILEYRWGGYDIRWELEPSGDGTRLTLWTKIDRRYIAMGAAGWHVCLDILDSLLGGNPIGRIAGRDALQFDGWRRLYAEYARMFEAGEPEQAAAHSLEPGAVRAGATIPDRSNIAMQIAGGDAPQDSGGESASDLIDARIGELDDWRGATLAWIRAAIKKADPEAVEEWKWRGVPVWSHAGIICTGETYKSVVKVTFARGASLDDPSRLFNSSLEGNTRRAIDIRAGEKVDEAALIALIRAAVALNTSSAARKRAK